MSLELVTARARTRGKSPVEFTYQAVGRLRPRKVLDKDQNPVKRADGSEVEVDDVETTSLTEDFNDVLTLLGSLTEEERGKRTPLQMAIDSTLEGFNYNSRKNAAPVTEQVTEDELTPITVAFVEKQLMTDTEATTWRRTITQAAKLMEMERLDYVKLAPQYKKLLATGWKYPAAA
jgi:hypothetical protein